MTGPRRRSAAAPPTHSGGAAGELFGGDDQTQELFRTLDWSRTGLGSVSTWPAELVAAVRTVLPSRIPMMLWWGPGMVQIYNDAFRVLLADKHPAAAGQPAAGCWTETWDQLAPVAAGVLAGSAATYFQDQLVLISRSGFVEETYELPVTSRTYGICLS